MKICNIVYFIAISPFDYSFNSFIFKELLNYG